MMGKFGTERKRGEGAALIAELNRKWAPPAPAGAETKTSGSVGTTFDVKIDCQAYEATPKQENEITRKLVEALGANPNGPWPSEETILIAGVCRNPRMVVGRLSDGRRVSVWQSRGRALRVGAKIACKLDLTHKGGDPMYLPV